MSEEIKFTDMQVLSLQPGDVVVLRTQGHVTDAIYQRLKEMIPEQFPGHKVLVLEGGMEIGVVRQDQGQDGTE